MDSLLSATLLEEVEHKSLAPHINVEDEEVSCDQIHLEEEILDNNAAVAQDPV